MKLWARMASTRTFALAFFVMALGLHEFGHAVVAALMGGEPTIRYEFGRAAWTGIQ